MFSMCSKLTPRGRITDTRLPGYQDPKSDMSEIILTKEDNANGTMAHGGDRFDTNS